MCGHRKNVYIYIHTYIYIYISCVYIYIYVCVYIYMYMFSNLLFTSTTTAAWNANSYGSSSWQPNGKYRGAEARWAARDDGGLPHACARSCPVLKKCGALVYRRRPKKKQIVDPNVTLDSLKSCSNYIRLTPHWVMITITRRVRFLRNRQDP